MTDLWYPQARRSVTFPGCGGHVFGPYRGVLHTTEGGSLAGALSTYKSTHNYPHFTLDANTVEQHCPLNVGATALMHPANCIDTNRASAVQIEIVGFTANSPAMPGAVSDRLSTLMRWIEGQVGVTQGHADFTRGGRMNEQGWRSFNGWCGHMHVPNNDHTDPGNVPVDRLFTSQKVQPMFNPPAHLEDIVADLACPSGGAWLLAPSGAVYAFGGAPFRGGANGQPYFAGRSAARLEPGTAGHLYTIVATSGERYDY